MIIQKRYNDVDFFWKPPPPLRILHVVCPLGRHQRPTRARSLTDCYHKLLDLTSPSG